MSHCNHNDKTLRLVLTDLEGVDGLADATPDRLDVTAR